MNPTAVEPDGTEPDGTEPDGTLRRHLRAAGERRSVIGQPEMRCGDTKRALGLPALRHPPTACGGRAGNRRVLAVPGDTSGRGTSTVTDSLTVTNTVTVTG
jgi:hypothetical protein